MDQLGRSVKKDANKGRSDMPRAILSVSDKSGLVPFARGLEARGFELVSTGGTAKSLADAGVKVVNVSAVTGFPEMMDGRVKTLHPQIHGGILARRSHRPVLDAAQAHGIGLVDIVCVNLYPFAATAANPDIRFDDLIEQIDIGGPSLVRAAAKNFRDVLVVVSPADYPLVLEAIDAEEGPSLALRFELARRAFAHTGQYDTAIATTMNEVRIDQDAFVRDADAAVLTPNQLTIDAHKVRDLRYGENPHQPAAWYAIEPPVGLGNPFICQGKELSFTNLLDIDAAARMALEFEKPAACVIKHTNPCGAATGDSVVEAYVRARDADPLAAFGGIVGLNRELDANTARAIVSTFIEAVIAPSVSEDATQLLRTKPNMRVVTADFSVLGGNVAHRREIRSVLGGLLVQQRDEVTESRDGWPSESMRVVTRRQPSAEEWAALRFAWRVVAHVKSNAVIFTDHERTRAIGAGQMSRVDAVKVATMKAAGWTVAERGPERDQRPLAGTVAASDAFFPFRDGLDAVAAAGATAVIQPGGSVRDSEVVAAADEHGVAMVFTGRRHFRH
jgi:phosphoribosylaminoimidazolecarboxamide formyltransferase/IMP cyclohydrolase